jgi:hypothetical protein
MHAATSGTRSTLSNIWQDDYAPLSRTAKLPDAWTFSRIDGSCGSGANTLSDESGAVAERAPASYTNYAFPNRENDSRVICIDTPAHPTQLPGSSRMHECVRDSESNTSEMCVEKLTTQQSYTKHRTRLSNGERDRKVAQRSGVHITNDGAFTMLGRDRNKRQVSTFIY